jgi:hypothetical protein
MTMLCVTNGTNGVNDIFMTCHASGYGWRRRRRVTVLHAEGRCSTGKNFTGTTSSGVRTVGLSARIADSSCNAIKTVRRSF